MTKAKTRRTDAEIVHEAMDRFTFMPAGWIIGGIIRTAFLSSGMKVSDEEINKHVEKAFREWQSDKSLSKYRKSPEQKKESSQV